jgi:hypothetical protein
MVSSGVYVVVKIIAGEPTRSIRASGSSNRNIAAYIGTKPYTQKT